MSKETRSQEFEVVIKATPEEVWDAITGAEQIPRWFSPEASVTPGLGGSITVSWGPGMEGTAPITTWEPGKRFAWTQGGESEYPKVIEFTLESIDGAQTKLRLVQSGFGVDASFDAEYDSTFNGWKAFLQFLRVDLESHRGLPARHVFTMDVLPGKRPAVYPTILEAIGFQRSGDRYTARLNGGIELSGEVIYEKTPGYVSVTLDAPLNGAFGIFAEDTGPKTWLTVSWYLKGAAVEQADDIAAAWKATVAPLTAEPSN